MPTILTTTADWTSLLQQFSREVLTDPDFVDGNLKEYLSQEQRYAGWLGTLGMTGNESQQLEQRLGCALPPSYRLFLNVSDGFGPISPFIWRLKPASEVDWLVNSDEELITIWEEGSVGVSELSDTDYLEPEAMRNSVTMRATHLRGCLMISDWGDAGFLALNPAVQRNGEWEAWHFANWKPGAVRYNSFAELMQETLLDYRELKANDG